MGRYSPTNGSLATVDELPPGNAPGTRYWTATARDELDRVKTEELGNGSATARQYFAHGGRLKSVTTTRGATPLQALTYAYRPDGSLLRRADAAQNLFETFDYDELDRLTEWTQTTSATNDNPLPGGFAAGYIYDDRGNLKRRGVAGGAGSQTIDQTYGGVDNAGPHAVTSSTLWKDGGGVPVPFGYDAVGNVTYHPGVGNIAYTPFNLPRAVTSVAPGALPVDYLYDAFQARAKKTVNGNDTFYAYGLYERRMDGNAATHVFYVSNGEQVVAQVTAFDSATNPAPKTTYIHTDSLGSTHVTDDTLDGEQVIRINRDPFGNKMTRANSTSPWDIRLAAQPPGPQGTTDVKLGFTGHEEDAELGLINMNGRIYDPRLGRMLQADPVISTPFSTQGLNRYSYVLNNPLRYVDPAGFQVTPGGSNETCNAAGTECEIRVVTRAPPTDECDAECEELSAATQASLLDAVAETMNSVPSDPNSGINGDPGQGNVYQSTNVRTSVAPPPVKTALAPSSEPGLIPSITLDDISLIKGAAIGLGKAVLAGLKLAGPVIIGVVIKGGEKEAAKALVTRGTAPATELLRSGGRLIGQAGTSSQIRILQGGPSEAKALFNQISKGGQIVEGTSYPGTLVKLPGGGQVGFRPTSTSGPPTIDVRIGGLGIREIKFLP